MKKFIKSQYVSTVAVSAIVLAGYYWTSKHTNKDTRHRTLVSSLGSIPYSSGINLNQQIFNKSLERSISSVGGEHIVAPFAKGDLNGDGVVSLLDVQYAEIIGFGATVKEEDKVKVLSACDMNLDKKCDTKDMDLLTKKFVAKSGDVNGDGKLSDADLVLAQRIVENKEALNTRLSLMKTALNGSPDKVATAKDLVTLEKKLSSK